MARRPSTERRRSDAARNREAILAAAVMESQRAERFSMQHVAAAAGVSRSTLYRHFPTRTSLEDGLRKQAIDAIRAAIERVVNLDLPPLASLRRLAESVVEIAAQYQLFILRNLPAVGEDEDLTLSGVPVLDRLRQAAELEPPLPHEPAVHAVRHFLIACLGAGSVEHVDARRVTEELVRALTEPLDQGLVLLDPDGRLLAINPQAARTLAPNRTVKVGKRLMEPDTDLCFEDGSPAPGESYPLAMAVRTGEPQAGVVRGHPGPAGIRWITAAAHPLRSPGSESVYAVLGVLADITTEKDWERNRLQPAGRLGSARRVPLDITRTLDEIPPHLFPEQFVGEAGRITGGPVALYVLDIDGTHLLRLAGAEEFPAKLPAPLALGPELAEDGIPELEARIASELPGVAMAPMWLRGRAIGLLLTLRGSEEPLRELARHGAAALELAGGYTDVVEAARRRKGTRAAAELQQSLVPPRIAQIGGGVLAGGVLPSYEVGGDWFDYVENRDGAWIAIADTVGKGATAGALGGISLASLRAARRGGQSLEEAVKGMHEVVCDVGRPEFFVTAIVARWHAVYSSFSWINCGHPPPLVVHPDNSIEQLPIDSTLPLGLMERERRFIRRQRRLEDGQRLILHSDGITARRTSSGLFGIDGIAEAIRTAPSRSAPAMVKAIQERVLSASEDPLQDDAVVVVLAPDANSQADRSRG